MRGTFSLWHFLVCSLEEKLRAPQQKFVYSLRKGRTGLRDRASTLLLGLRPNPEEMEAHICCKEIYKKFTASPSIATATVSHFNHKVSPPPILHIQETLRMWALGRYKQEEEIHVQSLHLDFSDYQTRKKWNHHILHPKLRNLHRHCYSNFLTSHTQTNLSSQFLLLPILAAPCTQTLTPAIQTQNKWLNLH